MLDVPCRFAELEAVKGVEQHWPRVLRDLGGQIIGAIGNDAYQLTRVNVQRRYAVDRAGGRRDGEDPRGAAAVFDVGNHPAAKADAVPARAIVYACAALFEAVISFPRSPSAMA